jgi:hypothetical protein
MDLDRGTCYTQRLTVNNAKLSKIATIHPNYSKSYCPKWPSQQHALSFSWERTGPHSA